MIELNKIQSQTIELIEQTASFIAEEAKGFSQSDIEHKGFNDLVSYVDKEAEKKLVKGLSAILPEAGFIAEEGTSTKKGEHYNWIIDPLDGTTNFIHGLPVYSISIALQKDEQIIAGVVYEVNRKECFHAVRNKGAYLNDKKIAVSKGKELASGLIATGFPYYDFDKMDKYLSILKDLMQKSHGLRRMGSAAVDLAYVACGRFEGFFEYNLNAWDVAAGAFIVQEAGGKVSTFTDDNNFIFGREILAAPQNIHEEILTTIQNRW